MRQYRITNDTKETLDKMYCNKCGKEIQIENDIIKEGTYTGDTTWGYFSHKDGEKHQFDLCEGCYDSLIEGFEIPVTVVDENY